MKVSIITPTLNNGEALRRTIDSVVAQSYHDIELVIVDGGSTDNSLDIIHELDHRHPTMIKWLSEPDDGVYHALNKGIALATGDVIGTLHGNDFLVAPDIIDRIVRVMEEAPEVPYVYGDVHYFAEPSGRCVRLYSGSPHLADNLRMGIAPPHPSLYIRSEVLSEVGGYREDYRVAADFELFVRLAFVYGIIGRYIPLDMVGMSLGGLSTSLRNRLITNNVEKMRALRENGVSRHGLGILKRYLFTPFQ